MIAALQDWSLFGDALVTGALLAATLPLVGTVLIARQQPFLAAGIGQAANLGIAGALWAGLDAWHPGGGGVAQDVGGAAGAQSGHGAHGETPALLAGLAAAMALAIASLRALSLRGSTLEARAAWTFLFGGSAAMLLLADDPHHLEEMRRLLLSSLLGASPADPWFAAAGFVTALAALAVGWRRLFLWATDPVTARALGASTGRWDVAVGCFAGALIGFAIHATGLTFTFGCTILPVLFAREMARSLRGVLWFAPLAGVVTFAAGWWAGDALDLPPGQCTVVAMALLAVAARATRGLRAA